MQLLHQRQGDSTPYPVAVEQTGDVVRWAITSADTARVGYGAAQLLFFAAGDVLAKQCIYRTYVSPSLGQSAGEPPEAQQPWVERVLAEAAKVTGMTARAVELPAGAEPTADYADGILTIGIPLGDVAEEQITQAVADYMAAHPIQERDPTVHDWAKQPDKPRYTADEVGAIAQTELQAAVDTALAQAKASGAFDGAPGPQGEQGPQGIQGETGPQGETGVGIQSVEQTTTSTEDGGTNVVTVTKTDGTSSTFAVRNGSTGPAGADGKDGAPGADGQDGTTPTIGDNGNWYIGDTDTGKPSRGEIGPAGADGTTGADGKSAYAYAVEGGYTGTETEFREKLAKEKFANPNALTFTGAATGSYDGSESLTVDIPSGGSETGLTAEKLHEIVLTEEVTSVSETLPFDPMDYKRIVILCDFISSTQNNSKVAVRVSLGGLGMWIPNLLNYTAVQKFCARYDYDIQPGLIMLTAFSTSYIVNLDNTTSNFNFPRYNYQESALSKKLFIETQNKYLGVDTKIVIWGIK